jgi:transcriptional regulator with GAF, ATPase, and Fis domain
MSAVATFCPNAVTPLRPVGPDSPTLLRIEGKSAALSNVLRDVETVASTDATVLVSGETGTGKELVARATHEASTHAGGPFVRLNCSRRRAGSSAAVPVQRRASA